jgi:hypothetical protein
MATSGFNPTIPDSGFLSSTTFSDFEKKMAEAEASASAVSSATSSFSNIKGTTSIDGALAQKLTDGIPPKSAQQMLADDVQSSEEAVRRTLKSSGATKVPQNVFDGLVSFHNQIKDITYAYVGGSKVDLTVFYKNSEWDKAASFIAADDRDRTRRIREATMMVSNDYGQDVDEASIIRQGLANTNELVAKGKLNAQTGDPATDQQMFAIANNYLKQTGKTILTHPFAFNNAVSNNKLGKLVKLGPWPY